MVVTILVANKGRLADWNLKLPVGALKAASGGALGNHRGFLLVLAADQEEVEGILEHVALVEVKVGVGVLVVHYHIMIDSGFSKERVFLIINLRRSCPSQSDKPISTI